MKNIVQSVGMVALVAILSACATSSPDVISRQDAQVAAMVQAVLAWSGRIDALVNNAGVADFGPIEETTFARWQTVMRTNLDGVFLCSQAVIPALRQAR